MNSEDRSSDGIFAGGEELQEKEVNIGNPLRLYRMFRDFQRRLEQYSKNIQQKRRLPFNPVLVRIRQLIDQLKSKGKQDDKGTIEINNTNSEEARKIFDDLTKGLRQEVRNTDKGEVIITTTPGGGTVSFRTFSTKSPESNVGTIQIDNVLGIRNIKIKFNK